MDSSGLMDLLLTLFCAELFLVLVRAADITTLSKRGEQRTEKERIAVRRGLFRSLTLEAAVFVPASVALAWVAVRPFLIKVPAFQFLTAGSRVGACAWVGIVSYGFPFAAFRGVVSKIAIGAIDGAIAAGKCGSRIQSPKLPAAKQSANNPTTADTGHHNRQVADPDDIGAAPGQFAAGAGRRRRDAGA